MPINWDEFTVVEEPTLEAIDWEQFQPLPEPLAPLPPQQLPPGANLADVLRQPSLVQPPWEGGVVRSVLPGMLQPEDLAPAVRLIGGETVSGKIGDTHPDIIEREKIPAVEIDQRGFTGPRGEFYDREAAAQGTQLPTEFEPGRLHSTDLRNWQEGVPPVPETEPEIKAPEFKPPIAITPTGPVYKEQLEEAMYGAIRAPQETELSWMTGIPAETLAALRRSQLGRGTFGPTAEEREAGLIPEQQPGALEAAQMLAMTFAPAPESAAAKALLAGFIGNFISQVPDTYRSFRAAAQRGDWDEARKIAVEAGFGAAYTALAAKGLHEQFRSWQAEAKGASEFYNQYKKTEPTAKDTDSLVKEAIESARNKGPSPEFRAFFGGIDPAVAGTTAEKVSAFARSLGMEYRPPVMPVEKPPEVPPVAPAPVVATKPPVIPPEPAAAAAKPPAAPEPVKPPTPQAVVKVTPAEFVQKIDALDIGERNRLSTAAGLSAKTIQDLETYASARERMAQKVEAFKKMPPGPERDAELIKLGTYSTASQLPNEAIMVATDFGQWSKAQTPELQVDRPLDWKKNPEVAKWLVENWKRIGLFSRDDAGNIIEHPNLQEVRESLAKPAAAAPKPTPAAKPAAAGVTQKPHFRGTSLEEWKNIQAGQRPKAAEGPWVTPDRAYAEKYRARAGATGVLIELKPSANAKLTMVTSDPGDVRRRGDWTIKDVLRVTDSTGKVIYEAPAEGAPPAAKPAAAPAPAPAPAAKPPQVPADVETMLRLPVPEVAEARKRLTVFRGENDKVRRQFGEIDQQIRELEKRILNTRGRARGKIKSATTKADRDKYSALQTERGKLRTQMATIDQISKADREAVEKADDIAIINDPKQPLLRRLDRLYRLQGSQDPAIAQALSAETYRVIREKYPDATDAELQRIAPEVQRAAYFGEDPWKSPNTPTVPELRRKALEAAMQHPDVVSWEYLPAELKDRINRYTPSRRAYQPEPKPVEDLTVPELESLKKALINASNNVRREIAAKEAAAKKAEAEASAQEEKLLVEAQAVADSAGKPGTKGGRTAKEVRDELVAKIQGAIEKVIAHDKTTLTLQEGGDYLAVGQESGDGAFGTIEPSKGGFKVTARNIKAAKEGFSVTVKTEEQAKFVIKAMASRGVGKVVIGVPGDGVFRLFNDGPTLLSVWRQAKAIDISVGGKVGIRRGEAVEPPPEEIKTGKDWREAVAYHDLTEKDQIYDWSPALRKVAQKVNPEQPETVTVADVNRWIEEQGKPPTVAAPKPPPEAPAPAPAVPVSDRKVEIRNLRIELQKLQNKLDREVEKMGTMRPPSITAELTRKISDQMAKVQDRIDVLEAQEKAEGRIPISELSDTDILRLAVSAGFETGKYFSDSQFAKSVRIRLQDLDDKGLLDRSVLKEEPKAEVPAPAPAAAAGAAPAPGKPLITKERADVIRERLKKKLAEKPPVEEQALEDMTDEEVLEARAKVDPSIFSDAVQIGAHYIQSGLHKFEDWAAQMRKDFGEAIESQLRSIYETARITIESPSGQESSNLRPGLQPGLRPPEDRVVTARSEQTKPYSEHAVPAELLPHLEKHQRHGVSVALTSMNGRGGALIADGTGVGKTREALAIAQFHAGLPGTKVLIITRAETIKPDWKKGTFGGSYFNDAKAMGIKVRLAKDAVLNPGEIGITTYENTKAVEKNADPNTVLIWDESHSLKNKSQRGVNGDRANAKAKSVLFMSATPADKPEHIYYLTRMGIMEGKSEGQQLKDLGMMLVKMDKLVKDEATGQMVKKRVHFWAPDPAIPEAERNARFNALFDRMTQNGAMIKREISMQGVHVQVLKVSLPPEAHETLQTILHFFEADTIDDLKGLKKAIVLMHLRRQQEPFKIAPTVLLTQRELEAGRQVVIFVSRVNESEVGKWVKGPGDMKIREVLMSSEGTAKALRNALHEAGIHDIAEIHGEADQASLEAMADFQAGKKRVVIATIESGGTGINLDDVVGNRPRTMIVVTAPFDAVGNVQAAGRIWRLKTLSGANMFYLFGDTDVDDWNADIIGSKMATLGAIVEGQVRRLDIANPESVNTDDFHGTVRRKKPGAPAPGGPQLPKLEYHHEQSKCSHPTF